METTVFVTLCDQQYITKAKRTIKDLRGRGQWNGDIVWLTVGFDADAEFLDQHCVLGRRVEHINTDSLVCQLKAHPIKPMADNRHFGKLTQWDKLQVFTEYFKQWNRVVFLDAGLRVLDSVQPLLDLDYKGKLLAPDDSDPYDNGNRLKCQLDRDANIQATVALIVEFPELDLESHYFLNCIFVFDTALIIDGLYAEFERLMNTLPIMLCNEMSLMNLMFITRQKVWQPFPQRVGEKYLFGWCELNYRERPNWSSFHFLKYPVSIRLDQD